MTTVVLDAMGSDHAPRVEVEGAIAAARELGVRVLLVGQPEAVRHELARHPHRGLPLELIPAPEVITMTDAPAQAFRKKRDSSVHVGLRLVRDGQAEAFVSAGNTGAVMAVARFTLGTLPSVSRPALAAAFPTARGGAVILLDVGANVDSRVGHLVQFAVMGEIYCRTVFRVRRPRVALLSIGEEEGKGNELVREAHNELKHLPIHFVGNIEGRDVFSGQVADVVVCDGFIGNVALKISEGVAELIAAKLKEAMRRDLRALLGYVLARRAYDEFRRKIDYSEYGGAPLLGVRAPTVIAHGRSNPNAIKNAIRVAAGMAAGRINEKIERELAALPVALGT